MKHAPSVFDKMVQLTVIDVEGKRITLRGLEGQLLVEVLAEHSHELGGDQVIGLSPEGRGMLEAHVTVPNEWLALLPPLTDEDRRVLEEIAPYVGRNSRLASHVKLTHALNGFNIALGELRPWKTL
ncbi:hypothetical protein WJX81_000535 [Elliptochloris bilobata]|uniref:Uncharacterized protein n=1 Tax=Elliptochloris bilobata TaxID=381761 RepID=A0AAW1RFN5_9CHLO